MIKLALIGKNISHSRSQEVYEEILGKKIAYSLLDYSSEDHIPKAAELLNQFDGVSITSPYKKHFLSEVKIESQIQKLGALNTLGKCENTLCGTNTDYFAINELIDEFPLSSVALLGSGVMASICETILRKKNISPTLFSRLTHTDLSQVDLNTFSLVINCCSREFLYEGKLKKQTVFWDFNYAIKHPGCIENYHDGLSLLKKQASLALSFWGIS